MKRTFWAVGSFLCLILAVGCGGSSTSDNGAGGTSSGGAGASGGSGGSTGGSGGSTGGSGGATGGTAGANTCGPEAKTCSQPSDCVLNTPSCCLCGLPELSDFEAINSSFTQACSCQGPACGCATMENPNLAATCSAGSCAGFDVRLEDEYSGCTTEADCTLRIGLGCCEACQGGDFNLVAVNVNQGPLSAALCGDSPVGCPDCAPQYPANKKAACLDNHCQVVDK